MRYMIEFMYIFGLTMVYPNFWNQTSFSTNYYESGVHSVPEGMIIEIKDTLRDPLDYRFSVPLFKLQHREFVWNFIEEHFKSLQIVDIYHKLATRQELVKRGYTYAVRNGISDQALIESIKNT